MQTKDLRLKCTKECATLPDKFKPIGSIIAVWRGIGRSMQGERPARDVPQAGPRLKLVALRQSQKPPYVSLSPRSSGSGNDGGDGYTSSGGGGGDDRRCRRPPGRWRAWRTEQREQGRTANTEGFSYQVRFRFEGGGCHSRPTSSSSRYFDSTHQTISLETSPGTRRAIFSGMDDSQHKQAKEWLCSSEW